MGYCKHESKLALRSAEIQPAHCSICFSFFTKEGGTPHHFCGGLAGAHGDARVCVGCDATATRASWARVLESVSQGVGKGYKGQFDAPGLEAAPPDGLTATPSECNSA